MSKRSQNTNPAMQVRDISPHSIGGKGGGQLGGAAPKAIGDSMTGAMKKGPGPHAAANWEFRDKGALFGTQASDRHGFKGPNPSPKAKNKNPQGYNPSNTAKGNVVKG